MGIRMVRQPSETPNVTNIDDIIPFRYAYGGQNGYVAGRGYELSHTIEGNIFRINSGRVVLQGVESDIDANGVSFTIDNVAEKRYYCVYYEVNLATQTTSIKLSNYNISGYPVVETGDDLTNNSRGIAKLELYRFIVMNGIISTVIKMVRKIEYQDGELLFGADLNQAYNIHITDNEVSVPIDMNKSDKFRNLILEFNVRPTYNDVQMASYVTDKIEIPFMKNTTFAKRLNTIDLNSNGQPLSESDIIIKTRITNDYIYISSIKNIATCPISLLSIKVN